MAAAPAPAATRKFRRSTLIPMNASFKAESHPRKLAGSSDLLNFQFGPSTHRHLTRGSYAAPPIDTMNLPSEG